VFWIRIAVPRDLQQRMRRREWKFSLRTREPQVARLNCLKAQLAIERLQSEIRALPSLTDDQIAEAAKAYLEWALTESVRDLKVLAEGPYETLADDGSVVAARPLGQRGDGTTNSERSETRTHLDRKRDDLVARREDWALRSLAAEFAREQGIDINKLDGDSLDTLLHAIRRARVETERIHLAQLEGNYADAVVRDPLFAGVSLPLRTTPSKQTAKRPSIPTLRAAIERYTQSRTKANAWVRKTQRDADRVLNWFAELNDESAPITAITKDDIRSYVDALDDMPANVIKSKELKDKSLPEILVIARARKGDPPLSQATRAKYFSKLKAFFSWCEEQGYIQSPVGKISVKEPRNAKAQRLPFNADQLKTFFNSPQYRGHWSAERRAKGGKAMVRDGKFWVPLVGLFSGMRLGEIIQLLTRDVVQRDGIWCFEISLAEDDTEGPGKRIKTASSARLVPVHPMLFEIGFLEYVAEMQRAKKNRLFPDIKPGMDDYYSHNFSKYFARYLVHIGIKTGKTTFHSLRHNFAAACDRAGIPQAIRMALMGHTDDSVAGRYGEATHPLDLLHANIAKVKFEVDLSHLIPQSARVPHAAPDSRN
jgi:integrase